MSNKDLRILLNTPSKEEGEEQLDELLPLAALGLVGGAAARWAAKKAIKKGAKWYAGSKAKQGLGKLGKKVAGSTLGKTVGGVAKGIGGTAKFGMDVAKVGGKVAKGVGNVATGAAVIGAKAARKGVEAGASGDVRKLGTKVGLGRRGEIRRRKAEAESISRSVSSKINAKLGKAQNKSGSQANKPKPQPKGAMNREEFDRKMGTF
jgi:hypothetical protein